MTMVIHAMRNPALFCILIISVASSADARCSKEEEEEDSASLLQLSTELSQRNAPPRSKTSNQQELMDDDKDVELSQALLTDLWAGKDLTSEQLLTVMKGWGKEQLMQMQSGSGWNVVKKKAYVIAGLFDTGTNLFTSMVDMNLPSMSNRQNIWKHTLAGATAITNYLRHDEVLNQRLNETVLVAMVRSPISNLVSLKKAPYNMQLCFSRSWSESASPCVGFVDHLDPPTAYDDTMANLQSPLLARYTFKMTHGMKFSSSMDAYNRYLKQYLELQASGSFKKVLIVNYEDLVLNPEAVMRSFADAAGVAAPTSIMTVENPAKNHGNPVGRQAALSKIKNRTYMESFQDHLEVLKEICGGFDMELIADRMEGSYRDPSEQRPYSADCFSTG
mmetsp:Transcript_95116/g.157003  ORF Transcript_95116/g.157003 Transcript_95116/m.157003 type:complete len:390 (+) Transcript_95116:83-1252(+)